MPTIRRVTAAPTSAAPGENAECFALIRTGDSIDALDTVPDPNPPASLRSALRERLLSLSFHAFARGVACLLEASGYEQVRLSGRTDWRGSNRAGGYDLLALAPSGPLKRRLVAQIKQFGPSQFVFQRNVDELRGAVLRAGASEGLLVTTGQFSTRVRAEALRNAPLVPVRLIGGEELLDLLIARQVGVKTSGSGNLELDADWFAALERDSQGNGRGDQYQLVGVGDPEGDSRLRITVAVESIRVPRERKTPPETRCQVWFGARKRGSGK